MPYRAQMQSKHVTTIAKRFTIKWQFYYFYLHRPLSLLAGAFPTEIPRWGPTPSQPTQLQLRSAAEKDLSERTWDSFTVSDLM